MGECWNIIILDWSTSLLMKRNFQCCFRVVFQWFLLVQNFWNKCHIGTTTSIWGGNINYLSQENKFTYQILNLAFWLVHCFSVTSHYTYVWPYMEINAANVTRHKIYCGKLNKKLMKKTQIWWAVYRRNTSHKFGKRIFNGMYP